MKNITNKKIAIVGGGPGGLTLARLLQMNAADIKLYERDAHKDARPKGATLDLHEESGLLALEQAGLMDAFLTNYRPGADALKILDKHANILHSDDTDGWPDASRPEIDRGPLQQMLLDSLKPGTVIWHSHFDTLTPHDDGWKLTFKNGTSAFADLVIAADGANSKLRAYITPIKPFYSGITMVEGMVYDSATATPEIHQLLNGGKIFAMNDNKSIIVSSKGDGSLVFYTGCRKDENWWQKSGIDFKNKEQVLSWFKEEYTGWSPLWLKLFEQATMPFVPRPQYCMPLDQHWDSLPNLTMLGDAAHLMPPYAGEGVNMAMQDALELSQCLLDDQHADLQQAIAAYENRMRARASAIADITLQATEALHSPDAINYMKQVIA